MSARRVCHGAVEHGAAQRIGVELQAPKGGRRAADRRSLPAPTSSWAARLRERTSPEVSRGGAPAWVAGPCRNAARAAHGPPFGADRQQLGHSSLRVDTAPETDTDEEHS